MQARQAIVDALRAMVPNIPQIRSYAVGLDLGLFPGNYSFGVVAEFHDETGFRVYREDPEHQRIITELINPVVDARAAVQFTT